MWVNVVQAYKNGRSEIAQRHDFELCDQQAEKKQQNDFLKLQHIYLICYLKVKLWVKDWRKQQTKNLFWSVERCRHRFFEVASQTINGIFSGGS